MLISYRKLHLPNDLDLIGDQFDSPLANQEPKEIPRSDPKCALLWVQP